LDVLVGGDSRGPEKKEGIEGVYPGVGKEVFQGEVVNPDVGKGGDLRGREFTRGHPVDHLARGEHPVAGGTHPSEKFQVVDQLPYRSL